jgi:hypothetical protein
MPTEPLSQSVKNRIRSALGLLPFNPQVVDSAEPIKLTAVVNDPNDGFVLISTGVSSTFSISGTGSAAAALGAPNSRYKIRSIQISHTSSDVCSIIGLDEIALYIPGFDGDNVYLLNFKYSPDAIGSTANFHKIIVYPTGKEPTFSGETEITLNVTQGATYTAGSSDTLINIVLEREDLTAI